MTERTTRRINADALVKLCDRLDMQAALLEIIEGERIDVDLYLKSSAGLREALAEIERLRSDATAFPKTAAELREARAEIERIKSDHLKTAAELREALAENEHLRSDVHLQLKTAAELREALAANECQRKNLPRSDADAELYVDRGTNTPTFWPTDWFLKLLNPYNAKNGLK